MMNQIVNSLKDINDIHGDKTFNVKFFICNLISGDLVLTEHLASKWIYPSEINESDFMEADKTVLENLKSGKFKAFGVLHKYANPALIGKERELMTDAIVEKYVKHK